jgi:hypothetical protein
MLIFAILKIISDAIQAIPKDPRLVGIGLCVFFFCLKFLDQFCKWAKSVH